MRFLHLADVHLDTLFAGRDEGLRARFREATRTAFRRAVDAALEQKVDAFLVAGDLFDGERLSFRSERFLVDEATRLVAAGITVVYATGNHDPGEGTAERGRIRWPEGVTVLDGPDAKSTVVLRGEQAVGHVIGAGHATSRESTDLSRAFPPPPDDALAAVALLHTQVGGAREEAAHDRYAPSELGRLREAGFDYWALGHIHLRQQLSEVPGVHFPGNLQGRSPRETGAKGALLVEVLGRGAAPAVTFLDLAPIRWERIRVGALDDAGHLDGLVRRVADVWSEEREVDPGRSGTEWVVRVELEGPSPMHRELSRPEERDALARLLADELGAVEVDVRTGDVRPAIDPAPFLERQDAAGEGFRLAARIASGEEDPVEALGLEAGMLAGFDTGDEEAIRRYVSDLLAGSDRTLVERFRDEQGRS